MARLSVNINKVALIRNSRGSNLPDLLQVARDCEVFGAQGITVHPRPDERHIRYRDVRDLKPIVTTELNVEGNPTEDFMKLVLEVKPHQVTLVPDEPGQLTSDHGWNTLKHHDFLREVISELKRNGMRVSIFVDPDERMVEGAAETGTDRIELYTESYAAGYHKDRETAIKPFIAASKKAAELGLVLNAGHDLNLDNLGYLKKNLTNLDEVSIGHALISDTLYYGLENTIQMYLRELR